MVFSLGWFLTQHICVNVNATNFMFSIMEVHETVPQGEVALIHFPTISDWRLFLVCQYAFLLRLCIIGWNTKPRIILIRFAHLLDASISVFQRACCSGYLCWSTVSGEWSCDNPIHKALIPLHKDLPKSELPPIYTAESFNALSKYLHEWLTIHFTVYWVR